MPSPAQSANESSAISAIAHKSEIETRASDRAAPNALLIAYHYPPCGVSSGLQRTLCFSRDLLGLGWRPIVLTVNPRAYRETRSDQLAQIPAEVQVKRAFALDTQRHLGIRGRYAGWMALPDPWISWLAGALPLGLRMIRKFRPRIVWSSYPIATAHLTGFLLHRLTGVPWIADFRDPMIEIDPLTQQRFPSDTRLWSARKWVEEKTLRHCSHAVFVTPGALGIYRERYPNRSAHMSVIANGYDEATFASAELSAARAQTTPGPITLVHSGTLYPGPDRDPTSFFAALARLRDAKTISGDTVRVRLRATGYDQIYREKIAQYHIEDLVSLEPPLSYQDALSEMLQADGLLLFQGATSNPAVPAKLYEYIRARRPIFALVDARGETAAVLNSAKAGTLVPLDSVEAIAPGLLEFLRQVRNGVAEVAEPDVVERFSRKSRAAELARLFERVAGAN